MCGIVGYVGSQQVVEGLLDTLSSLEYRGYDSSGISVEKDNKIYTVKSRGPLSALKAKLASVDLSGSICGIGHTRWATHGEPSDINAHPHGTRKLSLVHNGIIENYRQIKEELLEQGYSFESQTDTEVAAKYLDSIYNGNPLESILTAHKKFKGTFAFAILFADKPGKIYVTRRNAPLIIGKGENENFAASDVPAILKYTRNYILLEEEDIGEISSTEINIYDKSGKKVEREIQKARWTVEQAQKDGYPHFMLKEIYQQPEVLSETINPRIKNGLPDFSQDNIPEDFWTSFDRIYITACGTAMHAGMVGKWLFEHKSRIPVECSIASEFRYGEPIFTPKTLVILLSQSGETADTLAALRLAKLNNVKTLAVVNVTGSSIAREADYVIHTYAGPEISVAATKSYITQLGIMYLIAFKTALANKKIQESEGRMLTSELEEAVEKVGKVLNLSEELRVCAERYKDTKSLFFIGRGLDYYHAMEGALKMKEISYIHCESYAGGELKHGTISLITPNTGVIAIATQKKRIDKMSSNIKEVCSRGANVLLFAPAGEKIDPEIYSTRIDLPSMVDVFMPLVSIVPLQLLAYYTAVARGCDVDKPRNLAKSVTVE